MGQWGKGWNRDDVVDGAMGGRREEGGAAGRRGGGRATVPVPGSLHLFYLSLGFGITSPCLASWVSGPQNVGYAS